ncbi:hypothetical protein MN116_005180 [Schistosoma mekongi]|uniref:EF-hand domain-containing protein n=1 Tax=Schistosoma mekongi TaxID=38744 RepID=A0AAE1ZDA7_SCHME|nr:hypothetical protein MN116_005180 [Schistosoma mekongi]
MSIQNLKKLLKSYDFENTGDLNKTEWIKLCSNSTINLPTDISSRLFNELDTDNDGLIKISDILNELHIWEASNQQNHNYNHLDRINNNYENELIENRNEELNFKDENYNVLDKNQIDQKSRRLSKLNIKASRCIFVFLINILSLFFTIL